VVRVSADVDVSEADRHRMHEAESIGIVHHISLAVRSTGSGAPFSHACIGLERLGLEQPDGCPTPRHGG
jgi:hypothetical protein